MFHLFKKYWHYYPWQAILAPIFKMLEAVFGLIVPLVITDIIDNGIDGTGGIGLIKKDGFIILALALIGFLSTMVCQVLAVHVSSAFGYHVRNDLFKKINDTSLSGQLSFQASSLETRLNSDVIYAQKGITLLLRLAIRAPFIVLGSIVMAYIVSPSTGWAFILCGLLLGGLIWLITSFSIPRNRKIQTQLDQVSHKTEDDISGSRVIRAFNRQGYEQEKFDKEAEELEHRSHLLNRVSAFLNPANTAIVNIGVLLIIYFGYRDISLGLGSLTKGDVVALVNFMNQIAAAIVVVANLVSVFSRGSSSCQRIDEVLSQKDVQAEGSQKPSDRIDDVISFENVTFTYPSSVKPALKGISFKAEKGQVIGIIGGTGSGKTTLADLLSGLYDCQDGKISLFGTDVKDIDREWLNRNVAYVSQKAVLFEGTIASNLLMGKPEATQEEMLSALKAAQGESILNAHEGGLEAKVVSGGLNFSGGQRQRIAIARGLIKKAPVLILDDSSSALDFQTDFKLRKALKEEMKDKTTLIISQRISSLKGADKILVLDKGEEAGFGNEKELMASCPVFMEISQSQSAKEGL